MEHDPAWYAKIKNRIREVGITNVTYLLYEVGGEDEHGGNPYVDVIDCFSENSLDFALVDGVFRSICANRVLEKIRPGGIAVIDNADWFLPCNSSAPNSRPKEDGPASAEWANFLKHVTDWRCIWTSNGVFDTAIWFKPPH